MQGFYWLIDDVLAGCPRPGGPGGYRAGDAGANLSGLPRLDVDLAWLCSQGVGALLSLTETPLDAEVVARHGVEVLHLPVDDLTAPSPDQLARALGYIDLQRALGRAVAVHCKMGQGRTGTVLAAYLIRRGIPVDEAVSRLRLLSPGAIGSPVQEDALQAFARRRDWIL